MPLRMWGPQDRLEAPDLNAAFSEVAAGRMPGALCPQGPDVNLAANVSTSIPPAQPAEGDDAGGYWVGGSIIVPKGLGGLHVVSCALWGLAGVAKGNALRLSITGVGIGSVLFHTWASGGAAPVSRWHTFLALLPELTALDFVVAADVATTARLGPVRVARVASFGPYK